MENLKINEIYIFLLSLRFHNSATSSTFNFSNLGLLSAIFELSVSTVVAWRKSFSKFSVIRRIDNIILQIWTTQAGYPELAGVFKPIRKREIFWRKWWIMPFVHYKKIILAALVQVFFLISLHLYFSCSRYLSENELLELPEGIFKGLTSLLSMWVLSDQI